MGGSHKGSNLALMVEVLAAACTHSPSSLAASAGLAATLAAAASTTLPPPPPGGTPTVNGELIFAMDPSRFGLGALDTPSASSASVADHVEAILAGVLGSLGPGAPSRLPGDRRHAARAATEARGGLVNVNKELWEIVQDLAALRGSPVRR